MTHTSDRRQHGERDGCRPDGRAMEGKVAHVEDVWPM